MHLKRHPASGHNTVQNNSPLSTTALQQGIVLKIYHGPHLAYGGSRQLKWADSPIGASVPTDLTLTLHSWDPLDRIPTGLRSLQAISSSSQVPPVLSKTEAGAPGSSRVALILLRDVPSPSMGDCQTRSPESCSQQPEVVLSFSALMYSFSLITWESQASLFIIHFQTHM